MFALELKEQLAQILAVFVTSILIQPLERLDAERAESPLRKIGEVAHALQTCNEILALSRGD